MKTHTTLCYFRKMAFLLAFALAFSTTLFTVSTFADEEVKIYGDISYNKTVGAEDALLTLQYAARLVAFTNEQMLLADVDGSKAVDAADALLILQYAARLIDKFPVENMGSRDPDQADKERIDIITSYYPTENTSISDNILIVKRAENTSLYGAIDTDGNLIIDPQYDSMRLTKLNGTTYLVANLEGKCGILNLDGSVKVPFEYDNIVSGGKIGWLAQKDGIQYILNEDGSLYRQLEGLYYSIVDDQYLVKYGYTYNDKIKLSLMRDAFSCGSLTYGNALFDLNENLVSSEGFSVYYLDNNLIVTSYKLPNIDDKQHEYWCLAVKDFDGQIKSMIATTALGIRSISPETHEFVVSMEINPFANNVDLYREVTNSNGCLGSYLDKGNYIFNTDTLTFTPCSSHYSSSGYSYEKTGDFYRLYVDEKELLNERFKDVHYLYNGFLLENIDGAFACISKTGKILIPFGETTKDISYKGQTYVEDLVDENYFGFFTKTRNGNYEIIGIKL